MLDAISFEFMTIRRTEDFVAVDGRRDDLTDDILVGEPYDKAIFWGIVFVLGLSDKTLAGVVVGLAGLTTLILGLITAGEKARKQDVVNK